MAEVTITGLPNATTPLTGTERVPMDQAGVTRDATTQDIADLAPGTDLSYTAATRTIGSSTGADAILNLFSSTLAGLVPASGGGTATFLRADGTFAPPPSSATDLSYDPATGLLSSSTGADVTLPGADTINPGLMSPADFVKLQSITVNEARLIIVPVRNNSGAPITKGTPVYVTGSSGTRITVAPADASIEATAAGTIGLTYASIANNTDGLVLAVGQLDGISTAGLVEGGIVWLSETTGQLTSSRPVAPAHGVVIGYCVKTGSGTSGIIYVKGDLSGRFDPASPGAIGGTTPAVGTFTGLILPAQSSAPTAPATGFRLFANATNAFGWIGANGFRRTFDGTSNTTDRVYTLPDASGTIGVLSSAAPANLAATASAGTSGLAADAGHIHQFQPSDLVIPLSGEASSLTVSTVLTIPYWPRAQVLTAIPIWMVNTAPAGAALQFDIRIGGVSIFSTLPTIAAGGTNSTTTTAAVFSTAFVNGGQAIALGSSVAFLVTQIGSSTAGAGLKVSLPARRAG